QAREIIVTELRRLHHLPAEEALGRSLAAANGIVFSQNRETIFTALPEDSRLIGVTAIVFEDQHAIFAHLPPGQLILVEDGLIYTVPDFGSWFPDFEQAGGPHNQAEPLGYASWTAPLIAQTELRSGDAIVLCSTETGRAFVEDVVESGRGLRDLSWLHHRDPDTVLEAFKDVIVTRELTTAAAAVISFPPMPNSAQIQTLGDVRQRGRDSWRHGRAIVQQLKPAPRSRKPRPSKRTAAALESTANPSRNVPPAHGSNSGSVSRRGGVQRLTRVFEAAPKRGGGWRRPTMTAEYGVPGAHGVNVFRGQSHYTGDPSWRHNVPRLPIIGSAWIWPLFLMIIAGLVLGGLWARQEYVLPDFDPDVTIASIDQRIVAARDAGSSDEIVQELAVAQGELDRARDLGLPADMLERRQQVVTELLDGATDVIRMSDVQRIGTLPEEFGEARVQGVHTPAGVFFVAGDLYQYRPNQEGETPELVTILSQGDDVAGSRVGTLWGLAFDIQGLYVTDGDTVFMLPVESQEWRAIEMGRINNQVWIPGPIAAFDGSIYLLEAEYRQIYRFAIETAETEALPSDWLLTGARDRTESATDMAIDGDIYILLDDGTVQIMHRGDLRTEIEPPYVESDSAEALVGRGGTGYLYEAVEAIDDGEGRIVAFDLEGGHAIQLKLPIGFSTGDADVREPFDGIQDVIVDESSGTIFIINADAIWTARYSLPPLPEEEDPEDETTATPIAN
ncbi:MAG: hypothetical protein H0U31_05580, partial [Chloroflexia bacterium]|nr:hypothetical protein [Chloroflexia bacterium]